MKEARISKAPRRESGCKACGEMLPKGNTPAAYAARKTGYCRECYEINFPMRKARSRYKSVVDNIRRIEIPAFDSDVFNPDAPWDWYEYFFPEKDR